MNRLPAGLVATAFAAGILVAETAPGSLVLRCLALSIAATPILWQSVRATANTTARGGARFTVALGLFVLCGACAHHRGLRRGAAIWEIVSATSSTREIVGRVSSIRKGSRGDRVTLDRLALLPSGYRPSGSVLVYLKPAGTPTALTVGQVVSVVGEVIALPQKRNPSDFDYGRYLRRRGVGARQYADASSIAVLAAAPPVHQLIARARTAVRQHIDRSVRRPASRAILIALLIGDRSDIEDRLRDDFRDAGLIHLLAVSGLHVMVVGFAFFNVAGPLLRRTGLRWARVERIRASATGLLLLSYMVLTGGAPSVVRATVMAVTFLLSAAARRKTNSLNALFVAATIILLVSPWSLFEPGFQLSMSAVAAILVLNPLLALSRCGLWLASRASQAVTSSLTVTLSATLGVTPVLLAHFGEVHLAGVVFNLPAIPLASGALISGAVSALSGVVADTGVPFARAAETCIELLIRIARTGSRHLGFAAITAFPRPLSLIALVTGILAVASWKTCFRWKIVGLTMCCILLDCSLHLAAHARRRADLVFFDVGQADASLLVTAAGRTVLIDTGDGRHGSDATKRWILPHLRQLNIRRVDLLILSHAHSDHIGGTPSLLRNVRVGRLAMSGTPSSSRTLSLIRSIADSVGTPILEISATDTLFVDRAFTIQVLWPPATPDAYFSENNRSVVLQLTSPSSRILFTGDVEREAEELIVSAYGDKLGSAVVKVPHHGSETSSTAPFVQSAASGPGRRRTAVISVAKKNAYHLPDSAVVRRWGRNGFRVFETDRQRAAWFVIERRGIRLRAW